MPPVREYPPEAMTANTTKIEDSEYGKGTYKVSASTVFQTAEPWLAFDDRITPGYAWHSENMLDASGSGYKGVPEWIQLEIPRPILLRKYAMWSRGDDGGHMYHAKDFPNKFKLKGSNNGSTWTTIDTRDDIAKDVSTGLQKKEFTVSSSNSYRYFRLEVENVGPGGIGRGTNNNGTVSWAVSFVSIVGLSFFGEDEKKKGAIWNPLEEGFWSAANLGMWTYIGVAVVLILILVMVLVM